MSDIDNKYRIKYKIGSGGFGKIFLGYDIETDKEVAIKTEFIKSCCSTGYLEYEYNIYKLLGKYKHISNVFLYTKQANNNILVLDLHGPSLGSIFRYHNKHFSIDTLNTISLQMVDVLEYIHSKNIIHRDLKPENFVISFRPDKIECVLIDFGLAKVYYENKEHIKYESINKFIGTYIYCSISAHNNMSQSRKDDLESICYILIYLFTGALPWYNLKTNNKKDRLKKIKEMKETIDIDILCKLCPQRIKEFVIYCKNLKFEEEPNYCYLRELLNK